MNHNKCYQAKKSFWHESFWPPNSFLYTNIFVAPKSVVYSLLIQIQHFQPSLKFLLSFLMIRTTTFVTGFIISLFLFWAKIFETKFKKIYETIFKKIYKPNLRKSRTKGLAFDTVRAGDHCDRRMSRQIAPLELIFGWQIRVVNVNLGGLKGQSVGKLMLRKKTPPWERMKDFKYLFHNFFVTFKR